MRSRHSIKPRQRHVIEDHVPLPEKQESTRSRTTPVQADFTWGEPSAEGDAGWRYFIRFLIDAQLKNMRKHFGEAGPIALLKYVEEGKIDLGTLMGLPTGDEEGPE